MQELRQQLKNNIQSQLVPYLESFGFEFKLSKHKFSDTHDVFEFFKPNGVYLNIDHMGFNYHDYPWSINPVLGKVGFKKTTTLFDGIPLWYWKEKIAPKVQWARDEINLTSDNYPVNTLDDITRTIKQVVFDLDAFCKDFLINNFIRFDRIRQIQ